MKRMRWHELRTYWETHSEVVREIDFGDDPDGLGVVCNVGQPRWYNEHYARLQRVVYVDLLRYVGPSSPGARALDIGCGAGRWCRLLEKRGYQVTGIDLQSSLLERNRERMPNVEFVVGAIQNFHHSPTFDLLSSVTVLQHLPEAEQQEALESLRRLATDGAWFVALENVRDQAPHVFARTVEEWVESFARAQFKVIRVRRYDYQLAIRLQDSVWRGMRRPVMAIRGSSPTVEGRHAELNVQAIDRVKQAAKRAAITMDAALEPVLERLSPASGSVHCGFLFQAV